MYFIFIGVAFRLNVRGTFEVPRTFAIYGLPQIPLSNFTVFSLFSTFYLIAATIFLAMPK